MTTVATTTRRAPRIPPTVPPPRVVTRPDGSRRRPEPLTYLPGPPPDRPRFAYQRLTEEHNGAQGITFRTYADGHVVAYGRALDGTGADDAARDDSLTYRDWVATLWSAHPLLTPRRARLVRYLADKTTFQDALAAIDAWELNGEQE